MSMSKGPTLHELLPSDLALGKPQESPFTGNKAKLQRNQEDPLRGAKDPQFKPSFYCVALARSLNVSEPLLDLPIK